MMDKIYRFLTILICCAVATVPVPATDGSLDVGELLHRVARVRNLPAVDGPDAARLLRESGVALPDLSLDQVLTEGMVVAISRSIGVRLKSSRPDAVFDSRSLDIYLDMVSRQTPAPEPSATAGEPGPYPRPEGPAADPRTKGKGKKKGLPPVSESSPI